MNTGTGANGRGARLPPAGGRKELRETFKAGHVVRLPGFLPRPLVRRISSALKRGDFFERKSKIISRRVFSDPYWQARLIVLLNEPALFDFIAEIAGCPRPKSSKGIICRIPPDSPKHYVKWHFDPRPPEERWTNVSLTINVGEKFEGGDLEIKAPGPRGALSRASNCVPGDALLFRNDLDHRSAKVRGAKPKDLFVAWFSLEPSSALAACRAIIARGSRGRAGSRQKAAAAPQAPGY
ncbi:MAG: hypothetical protein KGL04_05690 [Elusimicrobia bacterium]|nr:hypothetical protein [Elusimicrobiota bacterium]